jgi:hypothetical protein
LLISEAAGGALSPSARAIEALASIFGLVFRRGRDALFATEKVRVHSAFPFGNYNDAVNSERILPRA